MTGITRREQETSLIHLNISRALAEYVTQNVDITQKATRSLVRRSRIHCVLRTFHNRNQRSNFQSLCQ